MLSRTLPLLPRAAWTTVLFLALALGLTACSFMRLSKDIEQIKHTAMITGRIRGTAPGGGAVLVVLRCERAGQRVERLPPGVTQYGFFIPPATPCWIAAFQDRNGDAKWQSGEVVGALSTEPVLVAARQQRTLPDVVLAAGRPGHGWHAADLDLSRDPLQERLPFSRGDLATLDDPIFDPEHAEEGLWTPLTAAKKVGFGVYLLEEHAPERVPVLFVHGMSGTPRDFRRLVDTLDRRRYEPWMAYYPSGIRLPITAHVLHDILLELRDRHRPKGLVIAAHSMGGLVARAAVLELAREGQADVVSGLVTFSTPYEGHSAARMGVEMSPEVVPSWADMTPGSELLRSLHAPLPKSVPFFLFFGFGGRSTLVGENNDGSVTLASQLARYAQDDAVRVLGYPLEHTEILSADAPVREFHAVLAGLSFAPDRPSHFLLPAKRRDSLPRSP